MTDHPAEFFVLSTAMHAKLFDGVVAVWDALSRIPDVLFDVLGRERTVVGRIMPGAYVGDGPMYIGEGAVVEPGACVMAPAYIGPGAVVRSGAYVRENCVLLAGALLGHASEAKSAILLEDAKAPHFAYVGDSILGRRVNLGAGTKLSNVPISRRGSATIVIDGVDTGLRKLGAIVGDDVQVGCNAVLSPGTLVRPGTLIYPNVSVRKGRYGPGVLVKLRQEIVVEPRADDAR